MKELQKLGLTKNEIQVYLTILKSGASTIQSIAKTSEVKRTSVYACLEKLKKLGLITEGRRNKKRVYVAESPDKLMEKLEAEEKEIQKNLKQKKEMIRNLIPELKAISEKPVQIPKIRLYEGLPALWNIAEDFLQSKSDLYTLGSYQKTWQLVDAKKFDQIITQRRRQIGKSKVFVITDNNPRSIKHYLQRELDFREYRFLPEEITLNFHVGVYHNRVILASSEEPFWGMIIESQELAETVKFMWEIAWKSLAGKNLPKKKNF